MQNKAENPALTVLSKYRDLVWPQINKYLKGPQYPTFFAVPPKFKKDNQFHWKSVADYPERKGKYLRPSLLLLTYEAMGGNIKKALPIAAAMQVSEEWLLIHDDIQDDSRQRRGKPALHLIYGKEVAMNAGDNLHVVMWRLIFDGIKNLNGVGEKLVDEFYKIFSRTVLGQTTEVSWIQQNRINLTDKDWFFVCDGKTSYYTIAGPMRLGAILGGATDKQLQIISEFGVNLGRCFQLVDDVLDLTSDFNGLKKQTGNDIYEGKRTIILNHLLRNLKSRDRKKVIAILSKTREGKTQKDVDFVLEKMKQYKSIDYTRKIAMEFRDKARDIFENKMKFLDKEPARGNLSTLINFILERDH